MKLSQILLRKQHITTIDYDIMTTGTADGDEREPSCRQLLVIEDENKMSAFVLLYAEQTISVMLIIVCLGVIRRYLCT